MIRKPEDRDCNFAEGLSVGKVCKHLEITPSTCLRWRNQFGWREADGVKDQRELRKENGRPRSLWLTCGGVFSCHTPEAAKVCDCSSGRPDCRRSPSETRTWCLYTLTG